MPGTSLMLHGKDTDCRDTNRVSDVKAAESIAVSVTSVIGCLCGAVLNPSPA